MESEKKLEGVASPPFTIVDQLTIDNEGCKMQSQQSSVIYDVRKTVMDKEKAIAYQRAKATFKSKNPFFISFMHPSYISRSSNHLCIMLRFARTYIPENCSNIMLRVAGRGSWPVTYSTGKAQAKISIGWEAFVLDNKLKVGDVCVFEVIKGTQIFMNVTIFRAAGSMPMQETDGQFVVSFH
ncbi:B3 domain-containing protein REM19-like [Solanum lycopersicum]|uniref:B3 domain-containing protein REM19-like n=1 Tax=Solanum lycopersicum TaxID=4081 RepID=UPI00374911D1